MKNQEPTGKKCPHEFVDFYNRLCYNCGEKVPKSYYMNHSDSPSPKTGKNVEHTRGSHADDFNDTEPCHCNEVSEAKTGKCCPKCQTAAPGRTGLELGDIDHFCHAPHCDCHSEPFDYERDHSHYHCWDTIEVDEGINGQEGHEKHLACCICRKRPELVIVPSGRIDYCSACKTDHGYDCPKDKPESKTLDEVDSVIEECMRVFGERAFQGSYAAPREAFSKILTALVARVREESSMKLSLVEWKKGQKVGALAVLADLEGELPNKWPKKTPSFQMGYDDALSKVRTVIASLRASLGEK